MPKNDTIYSTNNKTGHFGIWHFSIILSILMFVSSMILEIIIDIQSGGNNPTGAAMAGMIPAFVIVVSIVIFIISIVKLREDKKIIRYQSEKNVAVRLKKIEKAHNQSKIFINTVYISLLMFITGGFATLILVPASIIWLIVLLFKKKDVKACIWYIVYPLIICIWLYISSSTHQY